MIELEPADIITVDYPWRYKNFSDTARGAAAAHYVGMTYEQGLALTPVLGKVRKKDSIIVQWTTWPKLDQGMDLLREWGWNYVTGFPWIKTVADLTSIKRTVGFWSMGCSEVVLIGRTGSVGASNTAGLRCTKGQDLEGGNVLGLLCGSERQFYDRHAKRVKDGTTHSHKPYGIAEWLEEKFPGAVFTELFATQERPGWNTVGHRLGTHIDPSGILPLDEAVRRGVLPEGYDPFHDPIRKGQKRPPSAPDQLGDVKKQMESCLECGRSLVEESGVGILFPFDDDKGYHRACWDGRDRKTEDVELMSSPDMRAALHQAMMDF